MVSKFGHALVDLLYRARIGAIPLEVPLIVSNHRDFEDVAKAQDIPFVHLPTTKDNKPEQEAKLAALMDEHKIDLVVLARYMQILSDDFCKRGRAGSSTSTTASCPASRAPSPTPRRMSAASS